MNYILIVGNVADGLKFIGPWTTPADGADVADYASEHFPDQHWDVISLEAPLE
jgi:hypothetical protein